MCKMIIKQNISQIKYNFLFFKQAEIHGTFIFSFKICISLNKFLEVLGYESFEVLKNKKFRWNKNLMLFFFLKCARKSLRCQKQSASLSQEQVYLWGYKNHQKNLGSDNGKFVLKDVRNITYSKSPGKENALAQSSLVLYLMYSGPDF